jgi:hypothetical protein
MKINKPAGVKIVDSIMVVALILAFLYFIATFGYLFIQIFGGISL